jgi:hypothetical protein
MTAMIHTPLRHLVRRTRFWVLSASATVMFGVALATPSAALADSASWSAEPASASWSVEPASASWSVTPNPSSTDPGTTQTGDASTTPGTTPISD